MIKKSPRKSSDAALLRIFDANFNRSKEAVRVCEDFSRFLMNDSALSSSFKRLRHDLTQTILMFPMGYRKLVESRDSVNDVGRLNGIQDKKKSDWQDIMTANLKRAEEALRVLEEISKIVNPPGSLPFLKLRFRMYELEKRSIQKF